MHWDNGEAAYMECIFWEGQKSQRSKLYNWSEKSEYVSEKIDGIQEGLWVWVKVSSW